MKNKLRELRRDIRQKEVAAAIGITTSYYGMIETGRRKPSLDVAIKISQYYGVPIDNIFITYESNKMLNS